MGNAFLALFLGILSYSVLNIGLCMEKKGAASLPTIENESAIQNLKNFLTNKVWLIGFILTNLQWFFFAAAVDQGSLSLVSPMIGVGLVVLVIFSYFYLKEPVSKDEIIGIVGVIIGVVILGATSQSTDESYTLSEFNALLGKLPSLVFIIVSLGLIIIPVIFSFSRGYKKADIITGFCSGICTGFGGIFSKGLMSAVDMENLFGSLGSAIIEWTWWLWLALMLLANGTSMVLQQVGFQKGKAIVVAPIFSVVGVVSAVIAGVTVFSEWNGVPSGIIMIKIFAIAVIIVGVGILSFYSTKKDQSEATIEEPVKE